MSATQVTLLGLLFLAFAGGYTNTSTSASPRKSGFKFDEI
jgi:hypothetical protein